MPGQIQAVPGKNTLYATRQATLFNEDSSILWTLRYPNGNRGLITYPQSYTFRGGWWPSRGGMRFCGDPASPCSLIQGQGDSSGISGVWSPWVFGNQGTQSLKYIMGVCYDSVGGTVSGAVVQGFLTATDRFVRETTADSNGVYELGTEYPGSQHYLVAYRTGSPDIAGTTVNTLTGTNRDGT